MSDEAGGRREGAAVTAPALIQSVSATAPEAASTRGFFLPVFSVPQRDLGPAEASRPTEPTCRQFQVPRASLHTSEVQICGYLAMRKAVAKRKPNTSRR